jgi:hypothetical protein
MFGSLRFGRADNHHLRSHSVSLLVTVKFTQLVFNAAFLESSRAPLSCSVVMEEAILCKAALADAAARERITAKQRNLYLAQAVV